MEFYIVRHGQTKWNQERKMQGAKNSDLTELGIEEARILGEYLRDTDFDVIYTSPLGRTLETTENVKGDRDIRVEVIDQLQEMNFGDLEGRILAEAREEFPEIMQKLWEDPLNYRTETGEDYYELFERVEEGLEVLVEKSRENKVEKALVITHGVIINVILSLVKGKGVGNVWDTGVVKNTSLTVVEVNSKDQMEVKVYNSTEHLEEEKAI